MTASETEVAEFVSTLSSHIEVNTKRIIPPKELDIICPAEHLAIEYCGLYWHRSSDPSTTRNTGPTKPPNYHLDKLTACEAIGYRLLTIFSDEWVSRKPQVKSLLTRVLSRGNLHNIGARLCKPVILSDSEALEFLKVNHLSGGLHAKHHLGLDLRGELVAVASFSARNVVFGKRSATEEIELVRFAQKEGWAVAGGLRKLCTALFRLNSDITTIISYVDRRWFTGKTYLESGFLLESVTDPNYWYAKGVSRHHRFSFAKHKLKDKLPIFDANLTEKENMSNNGYFIVYDCGNLKLRLTK
jgi:hypothetical protein